MRRLKSLLEPSLHPKQLKLGIFIVLILLLIPSVILVYESYDRLKWQSFYNQRQLAKEVFQNINDSIEGILMKEEERSVTDYSFIMVEGNLSNNYLQRSPLSQWPIQSDIKGLVGHFQVDSLGQFSTPLLPSETKGLPLGQSVPDQYDRKQIQEQLFAIVYGKSFTDFSATSNLSQTSQKKSNNEQSTYKSDLNKALPIADVSGNDSTKEKKAALEKEETQKQRIQESLIAANFEESLKQRKQESTARKKQANQTLNELKLERSLEQKSEALESETLAVSPNKQSAYQSKVDINNRARKEVYLEQRVAEPESKSTDYKELNKHLNSANELAAERRAPTLIDQRLEDSTGDSFESEKVKKSATTLSEATTTSSHFNEPAFLDSIQEPNEKIVITGSRIRVQIDELESEVGPFDVTLVDNKFALFYRNVYQDRQRMIQGFVVDLSVFLQSHILQTFTQSTLVDSSQLILAFEKEVVFSFQSNNEKNYSRFDTSYLSSNKHQALKGTLLFESNLSSPLDKLTLLFNVRHLPMTSGVWLIIWTAFVLISLLLLSSWLVYRMLLKQFMLREQQQDFIASVSHELKTPLTSIRMYGEMLKDGWATEEKKMVYYQFIVNESERLSRLVNNILRLSKISHSSNVLAIKSVPVPDVISLLNKKIRAIIESSGYEFKLLLNDDFEHISLNIDMDAITQVFINLVDNGIKFSQNADNKVIEIHCSMVLNQFECQVKDYGIGISEEEQNKIFELFYRVESEDTRESTGTGIGLALVHRLCRAMDATIHLSSSQQGTVISTLWNTTSQ